MINGQSYLLQTRVNVNPQSTIMPVSNVRMTKSTSRVHGLLCTQLRNVCL